LKNRQVYDKFNVRMNLQRGFTTAVVFVTLLGIFALTTLSCNVSPVPGRFTYIVKYEVEVTASAPVTVDITDYTDELGNPQQALNQLIDPATPWTYESSSFSYDVGSFYPTLAIVEDAGFPLNAGETVTAKIIWKDYRQDFQEQVLAHGSLSNDGSIVVDTVNLVGPELPRP
jgi:hypothetical protein